MSYLDELKSKYDYKVGGELKAFIPTGKECSWPGCCNEAVKTKLPVAGKTIHCIKHQMRKHSGRVGPNWLRDHYRENLKPFCEMSKRRWCDIYHDVKAGFDLLGVEYTRTDLVRRTCQQFDVDHKDGNHYNNDPSNLQTLTKQMHKLKTDVMGDADPMRYKR